MLAAAAEGLNGANLTVLNGAEGLNGTVASLAGQGLAILRALTESLPGDRAVDVATDPAYDEDEVEEGVVEDEADDDTVT
jgi:hypothetical protein